MLFTETTYVSTFGYYMIVELAFIIAMCLNTNNFKKFMDSMAIASFSVLIVAIIIGLIMLSGDGSFDFDFGFDGISLESPKNKKINL